MRGDRCDVMWRSRERGRRDVEKQREGADVMWRSRERGRRDVEEQREGQT